MRTTLTPDAVKKTKPGAIRKYLWDGAVSGLGLVVHPGGRKTWVFQGAATGGRRVTLEATGLAQARRAALALKEGLTAPLPVPTKPVMPTGTLTVDGLLDAWLASLERREFPPQSLPRIRSSMATHVRPRIGGMAIEALTRAQVLAVRDSLAGRGLRGMANQCIAYFRSALRWAEDAGVMKEAPRWRLPRLRLRSRAHALTEEQWASLLAVLNDTNAGLHKVGRLALLALVMTGCRRGEIASLRWSDISADGSFTLVRHKTSTKTGAKRIPGSPELLAVFRQVKAEVGRIAATQPSVLLRDALLHSPYVFPSIARNSVNKPIGSVIAKVWVDVRCRAGLPETMTIHGIRGAFITEAQRMGVPLATVAAMVGHESPMTTLRHYTAPTLSEIARNAQRVSGWIASRQPSEPSDMACSASISAPNAGPNRSPP